VLFAQLVIWAPRLEVGNVEWPWKFYSRSQNADWSLSGETDSIGLPHFRVEDHDTLVVHFLHSKGSVRGAIPMWLVHGWCMAGTWLVHGFGLKQGDYDPY
jgi:Epoxide hydrolase N terminus